MFKIHTSTPAARVCCSQRRATQRLITKCAFHSASGAERTAALRSLLKSPGLLLGPAAYDGISARLTEEAEFNFAFMSGFSVAGARLAFPDTGLLSYAEMLDQGRCMHEATRCIPIIGDGDTGYGNAMNVKRTVRGYHAAGFAGILIEDQQWPKSCGHVRGKRVVSREEAIARVRAACDARDECSRPESRIVVIARTDARQAVSFQEAMARAAAFADAGADVVFIDALESAAEMRTMCAELPGVHKMANNLEGGGKTPILSAEELEGLGFKLLAFPLSLLGVSINAMRGALKGLKQGQIPVSPAMPSFPDLQSAVGFPDYFEEEAIYAVVDDSSSGNCTTYKNNTTTRDQTTHSQTTTTTTTTPPPSQPPPKQTSTAFEPDEVIEPNSSSQKTTANTPTTTTPTTSNGRPPEWLRIKVSNAVNGSLLFNMKFPAGSLGAVAAIMPQVGDVDLEALMRGETRQNEAARPGEPIFSFVSNGDRIEIYLE